MTSPLWEIITGRDCNLRCTHCYAGTSQPRHSSSEQVTAFLCAAYAEYLSTHPHDAPRLHFIGGEPLLHPELIDAALEYSHAVNVKHHLKEQKALITTNGTLIAESEAVRNLLAKWRGKLSLSFSIDGTKATHDACRIDAKGNGSWNRAIAGYKAAREILDSSSCGAKATYSKQTAKDYSAGVIALFEAGFNRVSATTIFEDTWNCEEAVEVYRLFIPIMEYLLTDGRYRRKHLRQLTLEPIQTGFMTENHTCTCAKSGSMCLGLDGYIYGCHRMAVAEVLHPHRVVTEDGLKDIDTSVQQKIQNAWKARPQKCLSCTIGNTCCGCVNSAFAYDFGNTGAFYRAYSQCGWTKGVYAARLEYARRVSELEQT